MSKETSSTKKVTTSQTQKSVKSSIQVMGSSSSSFDGAENQTTSVSVSQQSQKRSEQVSTVSSTMGQVTSSSTTSRREQFSSASSITSENLALLNELTFQPIRNFGAIMGNTSDFEDVSGQLARREDQFEVVLDVKEYKPEELQVRVSESLVTIEGKSEVRIDEKNFKSRQFCKKFTIPQGVTPENIVCNLTKSGTLKISAVIENQGQSAITNTQAQNTSSTKIQQHKNVAQTKAEESVSSSRKSSVSSEISVTKNESSQSIIEAGETILRPRAINEPQPKLKTSRSDEEIYEQTYEVKDYKPEEIEIKFTNGVIKIEGHQKTEFTSKSFYKEFVLPAGVKPETIQCTVTQTGTLTITAVVSKQTATSTAVTENKTTSQTQVQQQQQQSVQQSVQQSTQQISTKQVSVRRTENVTLRSSLVDSSDSLESLKDKSVEDVTKEVRKVDDGKKFETTIEIPDYKPEEIQVKVTKNMVVIQGRQVTENTTKEFYKKFTIPAGVKPEEITSTLTPSGLLSIAAPISPDAVLSSPSLVNAIEQETNKATKKKVNQKSIEEVVNATRRRSVSSDVSLTDNLGKDEYVIRPRLDSNASTTIEDVTDEQNKEKTFVMKVDVKEYAVEEITVTVTRTLIKIEGKHKTDTSSRSFFKESTVPYGVKPETIKAVISPNGVLTISAPISAIPEDEQGAETTITSVSQVVKESVQSAKVQEAKVVQEQNQITKSDSTTVRTEDVPIRPTVEDDSVLTTITNVEDISKQIRHVPEEKKVDMTLDVAEYKPEEIKVRVTKTTVIIEARQVTEVSKKSYVKKFSIPPGVKPETITSALSPKGVLTISAPVEPTQAAISTPAPNQVPAPVPDEHQKLIQSQVEQTQVQKQTQEQQITSKTVQTSTKIRKIEKECTISPQVDIANEDLAKDTRFEDVSNQLCQANDNDGDKLEMNLDVPEYAPEEIVVKITKNVVIIQGKTEIKEENKTITKEFFKRFTIPEGVKPENITSVLNPNGKLTIKVVRTIQTQESVKSVTTQSQKTDDVKSITTEDVVVQPTVDLNTDVSTIDTSAHEDVSKEIRTVDKKFQMRVNVKEFKREEIQIRIYRSIVIVEAKQKTTSTTTTTRSICKKFAIPQGVRPENIVSTITPSGELVLSAEVDESAIQTVDSNSKITNTNTKQQVDKSSTSTVTSTSTRRTLKTTTVSFEELKKKGYKFEDAKREVYEETESKVFEKEIKIQEDYREEDLDVKLAHDGEFLWVIIDGKQESTDAEGRFKSKSFSKMFTVPAGVTPESICCSFAKAGLVTCTAPINK